VQACADCGRKKSARIDRWALARLWLIGLLNPVADFAATAEASLRGGRRVNAGSHMCLVIRQAESVPAARRSR